MNPIRKTTALAAASMMLSASGPTRAQAQDVPADTGAATVASFAAPKSGVRVIEMRPGTKRPLQVRLDERNPYASRAPVRDLTDRPDGEESEENRIRRVFSGLIVGGISR